MIPYLFSFAFFGCVLAAASAQQVGQTMADVRLDRGDPMMSRKNGATEIWVYEDGTKIAFYHGVVGGAPEPESADVTLVEDNDVAPAAMAMDTAVGPLSESAESEDGSASFSGGAITTVSGRPSSSRSSSPTLKQKENPLVDENGKFTPVGMGVFVAFVGVIGFAKVWMLVLQFREGVMWGLGCMFVPGFGLIFLFKFWHEAKKPFFLGAGTAAIGITAALMLT